MSVKPIPEVITFRPTAAQRKQLRAEREARESITDLMRRILAEFFAENPE